jgi:protein-(glutamine-N5) methyltransferase, release factor-specific
MTVREAAVEGRRTLKSPCLNAQITSPDLDASLLLVETMKLISREELITHGEELLTPDERIKFLELLERRAGGECVAYILGKKEFRGLDFIVNKSVLVPRPDTEILVETILQKWGDPPGTGRKTKRILDLCTGSGAIAISLNHEMPDLEVWATDISIEALETAKANAKRYQLAESIHFYQGYLFEALPAGLTFHAIVSNPPYISSTEIARLPPEVQREPRLALDGGKNGLEIIQKIITRAPDYLESEGVLLLEAAPEQMKSISATLEQNRFKNIKTYYDLSQMERAIEGTMP